MMYATRRGPSRRLLTGALGAAALAGWLSQSRPHAQAAADLVLINGTILTVDANDSIAQAVAIADGRIVAVGSSDAIKPRIGANTRVILPCRRQPRRRRQSIRSHAEIHAKTWSR